MPDGQVIDETDHPSAPFGDRHRPNCIRHGYSHP